MDDGIDPTCVKSDVTLQASFAPPKIKKYIHTKTQKIDKYVNFNSFYHFFDYFIFKAWDKT